MTKATKAWVITAISLILLGCILFGGTMMKLDWNFTKLNTTAFETNTYQITESFSSIRIETDTAKIEIHPATDGNCSITCFEQVNLKHTATVQDGVLNIRSADERKWYENIGIHFSTPKITLAIPAAHYESLVIREDTGDILISKDFSFGSMDIAASTGDICNYGNVDGAMQIKTSTGSISAENIRVGTAHLSASTGTIKAASLDCNADLQASVTTGKILLTNVTAQNLLSIGDTGDIQMKNVVVAEHLSIQRDTGDVIFDRCDAATISVNTDTGDVRGTLLTEKVFLAQTDTGKVLVPNSNNGGKCEITTDTGNIVINIG